jgi:hypothetical protein
MFILAAMEILPFEPLNSFRGKKRESCELPSKQFRQAYFNKTAFSTFPFEGQSFVSLLPLLQEL